MYFFGALLWLYSFGHTPCPKTTTHGASFFIGFPRFFSCTLSGAPLFICNTKKTNLQFQKHAKNMSQIAIIFCTLPKRYYTSVKLIFKMSQKGIFCQAVYWSTNLVTLPLWSTPPSAVDMAQRLGCQCSKPVVQVRFSPDVFCRGGWPELYN